MNLIVVQRPAGTLHPQLHHPPRKLRSKGCHLFFSWLLHDSNSVFVFLDSMIFPHDNNCHNSCNLTPQETGCRPRSSASRSWDPGLDWTRVGKYIFRKSYFKRAKTCMRAGLPSSYVQDTTIWDFLFLRNCQFCFEMQNLAIFILLVCYLAMKWDAQWQPRHLICILHKMKILDRNDPHLID